MPSDFVTVNSLSRETGSAPRHVAKWLSGAGVKTIFGEQNTRFNRGEALVAIRLHQRAAGRKLAPRGGHGAAALAAAFRRTEAERDSKAAALEMWRARLAVLVENINGTDSPDFTPEQAAWLAVRLEAITEEN